MKIRAVGAELFHADGHDEANSRISQLCEMRLETYEQNIITLVIDSTIRGTVHFHLTELCIIVMTVCVTSVPRIRKLCFPLK